jgi:hypothetical protein
MEFSVLLNFECNLLSQNNHSYIPRQILDFRFPNKIMKYVLYFIIDVLNQL